MITNILDFPKMTSS